MLFICLFPLRGYSRIEEKRKFKSHDLTASIFENKIQEKEGEKNKENRKYSRQFTNTHTYISHQFHDITRHLIKAFIPE